MQLGPYNFDQFVGQDIWQILKSLTPLIITGLFFLGVQFNMYGWITAVKGDRIFRERRGRAKKYYEKEGLIFWIAGLHALTKANINPQTVQFSVPINKGGIGNVTGSFDCQIHDSRESVYRAIYNRFDVNRVDKQNDERVIFVLEMLESAIYKAVTKAIETGKDPAEQLKRKRIARKCNPKLLDRCGTEIVGLRITSMAPSPEQVEAAAKQKAAETYADAIRQANDWRVIASDELMDTPARP